MINCMNKDHKSTVKTVKRNNFFKFKSFIYFDFGLDILLSITLLCLMKSWQLVFLSMFSFHNALHSVSVCTMFSLFSPLSCICGSSPFWPTDKSYIHSHTLSLTLSSLDAEETNDKTWPPYEPIANENNLIDESEAETFPPGSKKQTSSSFAAFSTRVLSSQDVDWPCPAVTPPLCITSTEPHQAGGFIIHPYIERNLRLKSYQCGVKMDLSCNRHVGKLSGC